MSKKRALIYADLIHPLSLPLQELLQKHYDVYTVDDRGRVKGMRLLEEILVEQAKVAVVGPVVGARKDLCFRGEDSGGKLLVSEADVDKAARSARARGTGLGVAAVSAFVLALLASAFGAVLIFASV